MHNKQIDLPFVKKRRYKTKQAAAQRQALVVSTNMQDYLIAIVALIQTHGHAHTCDISKLLQVKMPSVTYALKKLSSMDLLIWQPNAPVLLTERGEELANRLYMNRSVLIAFFENILHFPQELAFEFACVLEHKGNDETIEAFRLLTEAVEKRKDCSKLRDYLADSLGKEKKFGLKKGKN